jgi:sigma-54 specific flagellar transcriptional regulator A
MMIYSSGSPLEAIVEEAKRFARSEATVLVTGETGTGKEVFARLIHDESPRKSGAFVAVNCGAIPESLIEAELFGHVKGAFTGAHAARKGRVALAQGGTLFLDEIGELSLPMQVKLLRLLQQRTYEPVGSSETHKADFRLVAATNRDLNDEVTAGRFRSDLYYRIYVCPLHLPPLRARGLTDLKELFFSFWTRLGDQRSVDEGVFASINSYPWPGNVRELENFVERLSVCARGDVIVAGDVPASYRDSQELLKPPSTGPATAEVGFSPHERDWLDALPGIADDASPVAESAGLSAGFTKSIEPSEGIEPIAETLTTLATKPVEALRSISTFAPEHSVATATQTYRLPIDLAQHLEAIERRYIEAALDATNGNKQASADLLGLQRTTLVAKCKKFGIEERGRAADSSSGPVGLRIDLEEENRPVISLRGASFKVAVIREDVLELQPMSPSGGVELADRSPVAGSCMLDGETLRVFGTLQDGANGLVSLQLAIPLERSQLVSLQRSLVKRRPRAIKAS